jgi:hypothetical protein
MALGSLAQVYLPWWSAMLVALLVEALIGKGDSTAFFSGFYGISVPWMIVSGYIDAKNGSLLSVQILEIFKLPPYGFVMVVITGLLGGLFGGFASVVGSWMRQAVWKND